MSKLSEALFTTTQRNVLSLLYAHPEKSYYTKEIIRLTGMGVATIKRELDRMLAAGILTFTKIGNQHHYQANTECPIYEELLSIVSKTFGIAEVIRSALKPIDIKIDMAFIYGSIAKNTETASSDIDLLVASDSLAYADLMAVLISAEKSLGRPINPSIYTNEQIKTRLKENNAFITKVMEQPKIWIKGSENDIKETG
ncbi:MAG: nucleotidyltransferase domain-containing protein [Gammaproteobacteria bacterium]|nr:nucleotidyltransferase domain-containing protein [Gammaproteobacteria bacterium]